MNERQFAAAHDRYLNPPDEDFDDSDNDQAEDIAHGQRMQAILDKESAEVEYHYWLNAEKEQTDFWGAESQAQGAIA